MVFYKRWREVDYEHQEQMKKAAAIENEATVAVVGRFVKVDLKLL